MAVFPLLACCLALTQVDPVSSTQLPTGKRLTPLGTHVEVGGFPTNLVISPDGRYIVTSNVGRKEFVSVLDGQTGKVVSQFPFNGEHDGTYFGLSFCGGSRQPALCVSHGSQGSVSVHTLSADGYLSASIRTLAPPKGTPSVLAAGVAVSDDGRDVFVADNQATAKADLQGSVVHYVGQETAARIATPGMPLDLVLTKGSHPKLYVSCERDGLVLVIDPKLDRIIGTIKTGANSTHLRLSPNSRQLFVSNSNADTISVIDTATDKTIKTILLRPAALRGIPGTTPLGMDVTQDGRSLFVALADLNAVAVVSLPSGTIRGYIPTGWYPTAVAIAKSQDRIFVASAKGVSGKHPNPTGYILDLLPGTVSKIAIPGAQHLAKLSHQVMLNNRASVVQLGSSGFVNPGIKYVIYVIKENRTYDNILGDVAKGNGSTSLCLFPSEVTPNQHALADRFALLDNFYVSGDVSADGWNWSTGGIANEYTERNTRYSYSGRDRDYDFEGTTQGVPVDLFGKPDVARPHGGYIWDNALAHGLSVRNYGAYVSFGSAEHFRDGKAFNVENGPTKKALENRTCYDFRRFDMSYDDSEAHQIYGVTAPKQLAMYGKHNERSRIQAWRREYEAYLKSGTMPRLMVVRLPNDHTVGTSPGLFSPKAMVADNDYAVGQLVDKVSHSRLWAKTAVLIVEDDAQAGYDHVDAHRSTCHVVSPYVAKGTYHNVFANTDSVLRTIEAILGLPPMNTYDAIASPLPLFGSRALNSEPYRAILPAKEVVCEVNRSTAYRAHDSARLIGLYDEESLPDMELNDILWGAVKGSKSRRPVVRFGAATVQ